MSASLAMGVMILPMIVSLSEHAMIAVPNSLRETAYGLGANKFEVATQVWFQPRPRSGALTLTLLVLPVVIIASQEATRTVLSFIKEASYAL